MGQQALPRRSLSSGEPGLLWKVRWNLREYQATQVKGFRSLEGPLEAVLELDAGCSSSQGLPIHCHFTLHPQDSVSTEQPAKGEPDI